MAKPAYSEAFIRAQASPESFQRGLEYYHAGSVLDLVRRGDELLAEVEGSQHTPYRVQVRFEGDAVDEVRCNCPYDWGGWCKHIVAVLLAALHDPGRVEARPALDALLDGLDLEQLQALVRHLAGRHPDLMPEVESWLALNQMQPGVEAAPIPLDPQPIRRQVRAILHTLDHLRPSEAYWHVGNVVEEVRQVLGQVQTVVEQGAAREALPLLEALTDEYAQQWFYLDDSDGDAYAFFEDLGRVWAEALLAADLNAAERRSWQERIEAWLHDNEYGDAEGLEAARRAAKYGWDDPLLQRVLRDEPLSDDAWETYNEDAWEDALLEAQLNVLERQERHEAFLRLAEAANLHGRRAVMLAKRGRVDEAVQVARQHFYSPLEALTLARTLYQGGAVDAALDVAEHGLTLADGYGKGELALWLREQAEHAGQAERALLAALTVVKTRPDLDAYRKTQALAGDHWPGLRADLLEHLRNAPNATQGPVSILLHEGMIDEAIATVRKGYAGYDLLRQVADAAIKARPDWVVETARKQAEDIMDGGQSKYYHHAADWLKKARDAYRAAGREAEWRFYLAGLKEKHRRKYALMPLLQAL